MANSIANKSLALSKKLNLLKSLSPWARRFSSASAATENQPSDDSSSSFSFSSSDGKSEEKTDDSIKVKARGASVTMPTSFMSGSIVGKRFYKKVTTRASEDGNGWCVMLDYRTLKTPTKRPLKLPNLLLAKAIAAEWEYQLTDGIRPFTMPLMKLACTSLERVPLTRQKIIDNLISKFHQDLVFCRTPKEDEQLTGLPLHDKQVEKIDPLLRWVESEFGYKTSVYSSYFGGKQEEGLTKAIEEQLKKTDNNELAAIDAITASAHSLSISIALYLGKLQIQEAIDLIRLEEDLQVERWGLVEGGHDVDIADLKVQISSAVVFLALTRKH